MKYDAIGLNHTKWFLRFNFPPKNVALRNRTWISSTIARSEVYNWPSNQIWLFAELKAKLNAVRSGKPQAPDVMLSQTCPMASSSAGKSRPIRVHSCPCALLWWVSTWGPTQQGPHYTVPGTTPAPATSANKREQEIMEKQRRREGGREGWSTWMWTRVRGKKTAIM